MKETVRELTAKVPGPDSYLSAVRVLGVVGETALAAAVRNEGRRRYPGEARLRPSGSRGGGA